MKIALATLFLPNYQVLANFTSGNKAEYCERHNYDFIENKEPNPVCLGFEKIRTILNHLPNYHKIWFTDTDSFITNFNITVEDIDDAPVVIARDWNDLNAGSIIVKNCPEAFKYLEFILSFEEEYRYDREQEQGRMQVNRWPCMKVVEQRVLNSFLYQYYDGWLPFYVPGQWEPGDLLLHMPGLSLSTRLDIVKNYAPFIIK